MLRLLFVSAIIALGIGFSLRSAFYALLFYLWIAYFRPEFWIWDTSLQGAGLSLYAGLYLVGSTLVRGERLTRIGATGALILLFCAHSLASTLLSDAFAYSWPYWMEFAKSAVVACLIIVLVTTYARMRLTLIVIALSLGFEGVKQGWAHLIMYPGEVNLNPVAFLGDNNGVAVGMLMLTPILLALAQTSEGRLGRYLGRFAAVGTAYRALSTYSRGGLLAFLTMCTVYWARSTHKLATLSLVAILAGVLLPTLPAEYWERMGTMTTDREEMDDSAAGRLYFWEVATEMAMANPVLGVGHNGYSRFFDRYDRTNGQYGRARAVHSTWFGIVSELGFPGLLLFGTILVLSWRRCAQVRRNAVRTGDVRLAAIAGALETSLITFFVGATFLSFQYTEILWHFFGLSLALGNIAKETVMAKAPKSVVGTGWQPLVQQAV